ncbi:hypothetical protein SCLCIDRAFT_1212493 [Scleroderma citrinum Foug A]|uniref:Uncharacterized protein n=1 Tax=Scleroderma citrinum Foug A TaxID=1036808 RepID=A0A0C3DXN5_9AGAM|nr:hypothetical protein SCLCIDRAFT_1212493 [Scleroderma citrinum Foug A]
MYDLTPSPSRKEVGLSTHSTIFPGSLNSPDNGHLYSMAAGVQHGLSPDRVNEY